MMKHVRRTIFVLTMVVAFFTVGDAQSEEIVGDSAVVKTVRVKGITCDMDLKMISANVEKLEGVGVCQTVKKGPTSTFEVKYDPAKVTDKQIHAAIEGTGSCEDPDERPYKVKK